MKKKVIISVVAAIILILVGLGTYYGVAYNYALKNENYTEREIENIALEQSVGGDIIRITKEFEIDDEQLSLSEFVYDVEMKTLQNRSMEMTISSRTGIVDID